MVEVILISHGDYAKALLESSQLIMGEQEHVYTFGFYLGESVDELRERIDKKISELITENEVLVLTDMKSGSPFNAAASLMEKYPLYHIAGINLPTFMEIMGTRGFCTASQLCEMAMTEGRETIVDVNKLMEELG
jgi:PTS system mannose-specific IIA component